MAVFKKCGQNSLKNGRISYIIGRIREILRELPMAQEDRKLVVLNFLKKFLVPISMPELLDKLGSDFKERSVRRWLNEMAQDGLVRKTGEKRSTKYQIIGRFSTNIEEMVNCFSVNSMEAIEYVQLPIYERKPIAYNDEWLESYIPNKSFYLTEEVRKELHQAGKRRNNHDPAGTYAHQIYNRLLIDLSYNSSRLEGNTYSLIDTERLIFSGKAVEGKLDAEKVMILNHKEAIRYLVENASKISIKSQTIYTLHYLLSDGLLEPEYVGKVRDHWVRITGSTYIPYENPKQLELYLEKIVEKASLIKDPFEQSIFLLIHISYLQPFADVNKRTARLSSNISLIINNLVPLSFNDTEREDYMMAIIAIYELQDVRPLVDLYVFSYLRTCVAYDSTVKAIDFDEIRVRYRAQRRAIISEIISKKLKDKKLLDFIDIETKKIIPLSDQKDFKEDIKEDLDNMDESRLAGLGVTLDQLKAWLKIYKK